MEIIKEFLISLLTSFIWGIILVEVISYLKDKKYPSLYLIAYLILTAILIYII